MTVYKNFEVETYSTRRAYDSEQKLALAIEQQKIKLCIKI